MRVLDGITYGGSMQVENDFKVLFIAGFGPIVRESAQSDKFYRQFLGIPFTEESGGYFQLFRV
jgi:hypothetical protein